MSKARRASALYFGGLVANLGLASWSSFVLPARVASHFDARGIPNGWAPRGFFVGIQVFVVLTLWITLEASRRRILTPGAPMNLPNRDYWLAPERRAETAAWITAHLREFGAATLLLTFALFVQVLRFNLGRVPSLEYAWAGLAAYLAFAVAWVVALHRRFAPPPP